MIVILLLLFAALIACVWFHFCNEMTFEQRQSIIFNRDEAINNGVSSQMWSRATYSEHAWALFMFKDPWQLYKR